MAWLTRSVSQYTVAWILISSLVGGIIGASVRFIFEDVLRPKLGWRRDTDRLVKRYTTPLLRAADALERRVNIMVRNHQEGWYLQSEYFRLSTLFIFGEYLGWVRALEREFGFVPFESTRRGREFYRHLYGLFRALSSFAYFRWSKDLGAVDASQVPRLMLTAIGEAMICEGDPPRAKEFTAFLKEYGADEQFRRWFAELDLFLSDASPDSALRWDRLIAAEINLLALIHFLDPREAMVRSRGLPNLDQIRNPGVRTELERGFSNLRIPTES